MAPAVAQIRVSDSIPPPSTNNTNTPAHQIIDSTFTIVDHPLNAYKGVYKDSLPYSGYFKTGTSDFFWVEFYARGIKTAQYSYDLLEDIRIEEENGYSENRKKILDKTASFRDGKIINGQTHEILEKAIITKNYVSGELFGAHIDVFAMHYYNRITVQRSKKMVIVKNLLDSVSKVQLIPIRGMVRMSLFANDEVIAGNNPNDCKWERPKRASLIRSFEIDGTTECFSVSNTIALEPFQFNYALLERFLRVNPMNEADNTIQADTVLDAILQEIITPEEEEEEEGIPEDTQDVFLSGHITTAPTGKIMEGIYWSPFEEGSGMYVIYELGRVKEKGAVSLSEFQDVLTAYLNRL